MSCEFGMPTLIEFKSIEENFILCKELGLDFIELNMNLPYCLPDNNEVYKLKELKKKYNIELTMHFPEEIDFGTFYLPIRQANIALFKQYCEWSAILDIRKINLHLNQGIYFTLPQGKEYIYKQYRETYINNLQDSFNKLSYISNKYGIKTCIENTAIPDFVEEVFFRLEKISNIYFTWDVGHDAKSKYKAKDIYSNFIDKIVHMHLHDYDGHKDHKTLFDGEIDIKGSLDFAYENKVSVVIEVKTSKQLIESVKRLKRV